MPPQEPQQTGPLPEPQQPVPQPIPQPEPVPQQPPQQPIQPPFEQQPPVAPQQAVPQPSQQPNIPPFNDPQPQQKPYGVPHSPDQGRSRLSGMGKKFFKLIEFDDDEEMMLEIRKHPFGLFGILLTSALIAVAVLFGSFALAASNILGSVGAEDYSKYIALIGFILAVIIVGMSLIYAQLYRSNVIYVTSDKIAQIQYITLFNRKISQLSIGEIQDITVNQVGIFARMFNYGTMIIETAGEQNNYTFTYVPDPYKASKLIVTCHEVNKHKYGN